MYKLRTSIYVYMAEYTQVTMLQNEQLYVDKFRVDTLSL